jgi:hypothetical protein
MYLLKGTLDHRLFDAQASAPWIERRMSCHVESARISRGFAKRIQTFHTAIVHAERMAFFALIVTPWLKTAVPNCPLRSPLGLAIVASTAIRVTADSRSPQVAAARAKERTNALRLQLSNTTFEVVAEPFRTI